ncbi:MAG: tetratricopeptide repeat protein [Candidatus Sumerlaeota bacterium]|nr:tetratricopeptide repeat protein [Candidatus Sumerlaeota bacterium]
MKHPLPCSENDCRFLQPARLRGMTPTKISANRLRAPRIELLIALAGLSLLASACRPGQSILVPKQANAYNQYRFAYEYRNRAMQFLVPPDKRPEMYERIVKTYEAVIEFYPEDTDVTPLAYVDLGDIYAEQRKFSDAFSYFEMAQKKYATNDKIQAYSRLRRGELYEITGKKVKARDLYKECYEMYQGHPDKAVKEISDRAYKLYNKVM